MMMMMVVLGFSGRMSMHVHAGCFISMSVFHPVLRHDMPRHGKRMCRHKKQRKGYVQIANHAQRVSEPYTVCQ